MTTTAPAPSIDAEQNLTSQSPRRRRRPFGAPRFRDDDPIDYSAPYVSICDRGALIAQHPVDPSIYGGGRIETGITVGRLACLAGLIHGRLALVVTAHLWHPPAPEVARPVEEDPA